MRYWVTFSRPGAALPFASVFQRAGGLYGEGEIAPLGGKLEVLPGGFSGTGSLTLSGIPRSPGQRLAPRDWVRVYLADGNPDPIYLGEVTNEPRIKDRQVALALAGLKERVGRARWKSDVGPDGAVLPWEARFRPYFQGVLARAVLPPGVTVGELPDLDVTLRARTLSELVADAFGQGLAATQGGTWGVDARARVGVHVLTDDLAHRFPRLDSDRPPGETGEYANCIRFGYTKPSGAPAFFEYKYTPDVLLLGESWLMDTLPSSVTTTLVNPYAGEAETVTLGLRHPDGPNLVALQTAQHPAYTPTWAGRLVDGLNLDTTALYGETLPLLAVGQETITLPAGSMGDQYSLNVTGATAGVKVVATVNGALAPVQPATPTGGAFVHTTTGQTYLFPGNATVQVSYDTADYNARLNAGQGHPHGFGLLTDAPVPDGPAIRGTVASAAVPAVRGVVPGQLVATPQGHRYTQRPWQAPTSVRVGFLIVRKWHAGDTVTTGASVTAVEAVDLSVSPPATVALTRQDDDPDTGRRVWALPHAAKLSDLILTGSVADMGWIGVNLSDEAGLLAYAIGRLQPLLSPVRSWVGRYPDLRRLEVSGVAGFDDEDGETVLQVTRGVYDLTAGRSFIEAGTPQALNGTQALRRAFEGIERVQRLQNRPGGEG